MAVRTEVVMKSTFSGLSDHLWRDICQNQSFLVVLSWNSISELLHMHYTLINEREKSVWLM